MSDHELPSRRAALRRVTARDFLRRGVRGALAAVLLLAAVAAPAATSKELRTRLVEDFEVLYLRDSLAFRPRGGEAEVGAIELIGDDLVVDGTSISLEELEARLGEGAAPFRELLAMDADERRRWLEGAEAEVSAAEVEGPEAPEPPPAPEAELAPDSRTRDEAERRAAEVERREARRQQQEERVRGRADTQVVVASSLVVEEDEVSRDVVVFAGSLTVRGRVIGDASAVGGSARVSGEIDGDLSAVGGSITLEDGAEVRGDVVSVGGEVHRDDGAIVHGQVLEVPFGPVVRIGDWDWNWGSDKPWHRTSRPWFSFSPLGWVIGVGWKVFGLAILALLACLVLLLAPGPVELVGQKAMDEPWKSGLVGLLSQILFVPVLVIVCLILAISVVGIPLLILVPFALLGLLLVAFLGYTAVAHRVGGFVERRFGWRLASPYLVLLVGFAAVQGLSLLGDLFDFGWGPLWFFGLMFGLLGGLVSYVVWTVGFGAALLTRFGTLPGWGDGGDWTAPEDPPSYTESAVAYPESPPPAVPETLADWDAAEPTPEPPPEDDRQV